MVKQMYRIIDSRGRVYLPKELRLALDLENGSLVKLAEEEGTLRLRKVHLIELGDHSPEAVEAYVSAAAAAMPREKQLRLAAQLLGQMNEKKEAVE
ncbi:MAG: AbrB/MazE/SpoVT family DNA-binding domain-containing protein [Angelakisella sp.]|jgi:AbrB family transcriptional regulator (stage V sporulation protein T)|nr:AbrB/MazE/SpoVT family DNA-binding domain-containing protein [Angelakisella sp.]